MSHGYYEGASSVDKYKGGCILRARLPGDRPISESPAAQACMEDWKRRNLEKLARMRAESVPLKTALA